jgi:hypothetical protein
MCGWYGLLGGCGVDEEGSLKCQVEEGPYVMITRVEQLELCQGRTLY